MLSEIFRYLWRFINFISTIASHHQVTGTTTLTDTSKHPGKHQQADPQNAKEMHSKIQRNIHPHTQPVELEKCSRDVCFSAYKEMLLLLLLLLLLMMMMMMMMMKMMMVMMMIFGHRINEVVSPAKNI